MAMLEVLAEMISSEELLALVAFAEFVDKIEMLDTDVPICRIGELNTTIATCVSYGGRWVGRRVRRSGGSMRCSCSSKCGIDAGMESILERLQSSA